eukprot:2580062-Amphidinium_carterae.1
MTEGSDDEESELSDLGDATRGRSADTSRSCEDKAEGTGGGRTCNGVPETVKRDPQSAVFTV